MGSFSVHLSFKILQTNVKTHEQFKVGILLFYQKEPGTKMNEKVCLFTEDNNFIRVVMQDQGHGHMGHVTRW